MGTDFISQMMMRGLTEELESQIASYEADYKGPTKVFTRKIAEEMKDIFDNEPERLLLDPYFLNLDGFIYPAVCDDILELLEERKRRPINLVILLIGIGGGKSLEASVLLWLQWMELSSHLDPQSFYNLVPGSIISFMVMNRTEVQARKVTFSEVFNRFQTPFNADYFPPHPMYSKEIRILQNNTVLFPGTSSSMSALGYNCYGGCLDLKTKVWVENPNTKNYKLIPISELEGKTDIRILSFNPTSKKVEPVLVNRFQDSGIQETYELEVEDGSKIIATADHQFLVKEASGGISWKALKDIEIGDDIVSTMS